jgi:hypothetical protein
MIAGSEVTWAAKAAIEILRQREKPIAPVRIRVTEAPYVIDRSLLGSGY